MPVIRRTHALNEKPEMQVYQFVDHDGLAVDLSGFAGTLKWETTNGVPQTSAVTVVTPATGTCSWTWPAAMFAQVGVVWAQVVVTSGATYTFRSDDYVLTVKPAAGG